MILPNHLHLASNSYIFHYSFPLAIDIDSNPEICKSARKSPGRLFRDLISHILLKFLHSTELYMDCICQE